MTRRSFVEMHQRRDSKEPELDEGFLWFMEWLKKHGKHNPELSKGVRVTIPTTPIVRKRDLNSGGD